MPIVLVAAAAFGLAMLFGRRTSNNYLPPSNPKAGDVFTWTDLNGTRKSATWSGAAWVVEA